MICLIIIIKDIHFKTYYYTNLSSPQESDLF